MAETTEIKEERNALGQVLKEPTTELHNSLGGYYIPYFKIPQVTKIRQAVLKNFAVL